MFHRAIRECACDNAKAVLLKGVSIGTLEVSLWLLQADDGGEMGYVVKLKHRRVLAYPGRPLREWDLRNLIGGLSWAMSQLLSRSVYRKWYRQKL
ncbi:MAG: hypothetical protein U0790_02180 [Isosphaeraceae bacterium]